MIESKWKVGETCMTRCGRDAHVLALYEGFLVGVVRESFGICACRWHARTGRTGTDGVEREYDLMPPIAPRIKRTLWLNIYAGEAILAHTGRDSADMAAGQRRTACIRIELDLPEGYGLATDRLPILVRAD